MLTNAFVIAVLTTASFIFLYKKFPKKIQKLLREHPLFTDALALLLTLGILGSTATVLMAGCMIDAMIGLILYVANHPEKFEYLGDLMDVMKEQFALLNKALTEYGERYRREKAEKAQVK